MKKHALALLLGSTLTLGCMEFPMVPVAVRDGQPARLIAPDPVTAEDISADNAHDKARQLAAELDRAEQEGEAKPTEKPGVEKALEGKSAAAARKKK